MSEQFVNDASSTLSAGISAGATLLTVQSPSQFPVSGTFRIRVDNEIMTVTGVSGSNFTVTRASEACQGVQVASSHNAGATVYSVLTVASLNTIASGGSAIVLSGDVTGSGIPNITTTVANNAVSYAKMQQASAHTLIGNPTGSTANVEEITLGSGLSFSGTTIVASSGSGTVQSVGVVGNNGISASVANATTTPVITLGLGAISPSSISTSGTIAASNFSGSSSGTNTGDQTITLTSDVTGSGAGSFAATIASHAVSYAKMQQASASTLLGNPTSGTANVEEITLGSGLAFSGTTLTTTGGGSGTVTTVSVVTANGFSGSVANATTTPAITLTLGSGAVTYAKIQNETASTLLGNPTGSTAAPSEITLGTNLSFSGSVLNASGGGGSNGLYTAFTAPTLANFTLTNAQAGATLTQAGNSIVLYAPANANDVLSMALKNIPSTPYSCIFNLAIFLAGSSGSSHSDGGVIWFDSNTNHLKTLSITYNAALSGPVMECGLATDGTIHVASNYRFWATDQQMPSWFKLSDDGTNQKYWFSVDGATWIQFYTQASNTDVTPNKVGFYTNPRNPDSQPMCTALWSYQETSP